MPDRLDEISAIPADCLPPVIPNLQGPAIDPEGRIAEGLFAGLTPAEVEADRVAYERACQGGGGWLREIIDDIRRERGTPQGRQK